MFDLQSSCWSTSEMMTRGSLKNVSETNYSRPRPDTHHHEFIRNEEVLVVYEDEEDGRATGRKVQRYVCVCTVQE